MGSGGLGRSAAKVMPATASRNSTATTRLPQPMRTGASGATLVTSGAARPGSGEGEVLGIGFWVDI